MAGRPLTRARNAERAVAAQAGENATEASPAAIEPWQPPEGTPQQRETQLADEYLTAAQLAREVSHLALQQAYREAKNGTLRDPAKTALNAAITSGTLLDKRLVLEGRPTQIVQNHDPKQAAAALARRLGVVETTATELPEPTQQALPVASESAKPRAHARDAAAQRPVD